MEAMHENNCLAEQWVKWITIIFIFGLCTACTSGIRSANTSTKTPESLLAIKSKSPDIRGVIFDLYVVNERQNGFYVVGVLEDDTKYDKASIRLSDRTRVFRINGEHHEMVTFQELKKGQIVEIIFVPDEILERYPVSAEAQEVLIISQGN